MKFEEIIGIDVSKNTLDFYFYNKKLSFKTENSPIGCVGILEACKEHIKTGLENILFCFEDTGRYSKLLSVFLYDAGYKFKIINPLGLKRSLGLVRGKTDKKDARLIAKYAWEKRDEIQPTVLPSPINDQLKTLLTTREKLIKHRTSYKNGIKDLNDCYTDGEYDFIKDIHNRMVKQLNDELQKIDNQILVIFNSYGSLRVNYNLLLSIKGIGKVVAIYMIVLTDNFTKFENPRKFACYSGIAPFPYSSGTSVKGRTKLNPCANKKMKSLLNIAAMAAIQLKGEYKKYYLKRCEEGKNKMGTLNIIRNKLVFRAFAVVKRGTPYVDLSTFAV
jgi:transposase